MLIAFMREASDESPPAAHIKPSVGAKRTRQTSVEHMLQLNGTPNGPGKESSLYLAALAEDTEAIVLIIDPSGVIEYANAAAGKLLPSNQSGPMTGRPLASIMPEAAARERLALASEQLGKGRPAVITGLVRGRLLRMTFRELPQSEGPRRLLVVGRPAYTLNMSDPSGGTRARLDDPGMLASLTDREMEILQLIGMGLSSADIAKRLERSVKTVEWHRVSLGTKLGVSNRVELARIAIAAGIVPIEDSPPAVNRAS